MPNAAYWTERLHDLTSQSGVRGAVLGIWADGQETVAAYGVLNSGTGVETTPDSLFQVGSITKVWTATMIMQLIDEGSLSLDTTVAQVLPGARICTSDVSGEVTIEHLLTHTSGIEGDVFIDTGRGDDCLERFVARLAGVKSVYPPGEAFSYANTGFQLLGRIIEVIDSQTWDNALRTRLTTPLGLTRTVTLPEDAIVHRVAAGHDDDGNLITFWTGPRCDGPAGAVTCDAHDLLTFARFHLDGGTGPDGTRVLTEASATAMRQQRVALPPPPAGQGNGLAWRLADWNGHQIIGHSGDTIGQSAWLQTVPDLGLAVCLLTNTGSSGTLYRNLLGEVFRELAGIEMPGVPGPSDAPGGPDPARHAGRYRAASNRADVTVRDGLLRMTRTFDVDIPGLDIPEPDEMTLLPADSTGDHFVLKLPGTAYWTPVSFGHLRDQTPYVYLFGRVLPQASVPTSST